MRCCTPTRCLLSPNLLRHPPQDCTNTHTHQQPHMTHGPHRTAQALPPFLLPLIMTLLCGASVCLSAAAAETTSNQWEPLRIEVSAKDLEDPARYCNETNAVRPDFKGNTFTCTEKDILTEEKKTLILRKVIPAAVKLHTDRLLVQRISGPLQVPRFESANPCTHFTVPPQHHNPGVSNADIVLYVAVSPTVGLGGLCASGSDKRPVAVYLLLRNDDSRLLHTVRTTAHEIAHALGFDYDLMNKLGMLKRVTVGNRQVTVVNSSKVVEKAREHFNCSTLEGVEFLGGGVQKELHWGYEATKDELMTVPPEAAGFYTALTMAAFEDLGFFRARWGMEEPMSWGRNAGCDFPPRKCPAETIKKYPHVFCNSTDERQRCTTGRTYVGYCENKRNTTDRCVFPTRQWMCEVQYTADDNFIPGSLTGRGSWCLDAEAVVKGKSNEKEVAGVCAKVKCDDGTVRVQYKGSDTWHECPEGGTITPTSRFFVNGSIKCPKYAEVCTIAEDGSSLVKADTSASWSSNVGNGCSSTGSSTPGSAASDKKDGAAAGARCYGPLAIILAAVALLL